MIRVLVAFFLFVVSSAAVSQPYKPYDLPTLDQYYLSIREYVRSIPEFKDIWSEMRTDPERPIFFSGGALRGALFYLKRDLARMRRGESRRVDVPSVENLLLQTWSDLDIVAPRQWREWVKQRLPGTWDILDPDFMDDSLYVGGATIEKVRINPWRILDPEDAIKDYLNGRLVFKPGPTANRGKIFSNSLTAQALRFLRIAENLRDAEITPESMEFIRSISDREWNSIQRGESPDYWIMKGIKKLYHSVHGDVFKFIDILHRANLLMLLAHHQFSLPPEESIRISVSGIANDFSNYTYDEKLAIVQVIGRHTDERISFLKHVYPRSEVERQKLSAAIARVKAFGEQFGGENHVRPPRKAELILLPAPKPIPLPLNCHLFL